MLRTILFTTRSLFNRPRLSASYSSLRSRIPVTGPRTRILNHVTPIRPTKPTTPLVYHKPSPTPDTLVHVPVDPTHHLVQPNTPAGALLTQSALVIGRQLEMLNVFLGYEQANKYKIMDANGTHLGYIAEEDGGLGRNVTRQLLGTHRKMQATILTNEGQVLFKIIRPYSLVNSRIFIHTEDDQLIGEVQQKWHLLRRKYDLFVGQTQFATIDTPVLGWDFNLEDEEGGVLGNVSRNFKGFAREIFTDTGEYVLRMDAVEGHSRGMTLDERAVTLACAISIDFDYFSRHSGHGPGIMPFPFFGGGGGGGHAVHDDEVPAGDSSTVQSPSSPTEYPTSQGDSDFIPDTPSDHQEESPFLADDDSEGFGIFDALKDMMKD